MAVRTGSGSISVLVDKNLATLVTALRGLDKDLNIQLRRQTKAVAEPVWAEAVRANTSSIMESRVLGDTARVSVSATNVRLRAGHVGKLKGSKHTDLVGGTNYTVWNYYSNHKNSTTESTNNAAY